MKFEDRDLGVSGLVWFYKLALKCRSRGEIVGGIGFDVDTGMSYSVREFRP